jgi:hypothetical protein
MNEKTPDAEARHRAAEERILTLAEELSETSGEKLIADVENDRLKPADLIKTFSTATNQVAAKRRWNQGLSAGDARTQDALPTLFSGYAMVLRFGSKNPTRPTKQSISRPAITQENQRE